MATKAGYQGAIYNNTGTEASPVWELLDTVRDVNSARTRTEIDDTSRTTDGDRSYIGGLGEWGADFEMVHNATNAAWLAVRAAINANTLMDVLILDGPLEVDGNVGLRGTVIVTDFSEAQPLDDVMSNSVVMKGNGSPVFGATSGGVFVPDGGS